ncbi:hypothetical protein AB0N89_10905 [Amycolatopsis sp. NPDC089917]|uniref:hypothetical protein n=1 Tax=Amycolatopsis sp. NPDC089917 TaxID=3155187 RepID=UPI00341D4185
MTTPAKIGDVDQERILTEISDQLKFQLPPGWDYVQIKYQAIGDHQETAAIVRSISETLTPWTPPRVISELLTELRSAAADPGRGTWLSAVFEMRHPGSFRANFNATAEPEFRNPPPDEAFAEELRRFPRPAESTPAWLSQRADDGS